MPHVWVLQEMPKNQHKKPMGILDAPCVGIAKSPNKNQLVLEGFNMGIAMLAKKTNVYNYVICRFCNIYSKN
jgi:hypothetical protein